MQGRGAGRIVDGRSVAPCVRTGIGVVQVGRFSLGTRGRRNVNESSDDRFLSLRQLAAYSGLSVRTLRGLVHRSVMPLPYYQVVGKILIRRSEFDAWMRQFRLAAKRMGDRSELDQMVDQVFSSLTTGGRRVQNRAHSPEEG